MASKMVKAPFFRAVTTRGYAQCAPVCGVPNYELNTTTFPNKLVATSADNESPITRVSIVFRAGSRNETNENLGITHLLRAAAGLSTKNASQFAITRNIQQVGASLTATSDRETISYTLEGTRQAVEKALPFLTEVATQQVFKPWEVSELSERLHLDIATRPLQLRAIDLLHNAAFRTGLGNSLWCPKSQIGKISPESLQFYVSSYFITGRTAVVGVGVNQSDLSGYASRLQLESGEGCTTSSPYKGGELRSNKGGKLAYVAVAGEGSAMKDTQEALAFAVLQRVVGCGPLIPYSNKDNGLLSKTVGGGCEEYASTAINVNYSDAGLFGVLIAAPDHEVRKLVEAAVKLLKSGSITDEDVVRGKNQLKTALLLEAESGRNAIENIGRQAALTGCPLAASQMAAAVDGIKTADVTAALRKAGQKLTLASIGNISKVPYLADLK